MNNFRLLFAFIIILDLISCTSGNKKESDSAESVFARAQELEKDGRTEEAIMKYQEVKNKYPYSKLATEAELAAADVSFNEESYPEAQVGYQVFRDLHPKHPKISFVIYRLAMSIFKQIPETIDRDLTVAHSAIETYDDLIKQFPDSEHIAEAKEKRLECLKKLADKELYITNFYLKKKNWGSALSRAEGLLNNHINLGFDERALARAALAAAQNHNQDLSDKYKAQLQERFPGSHEFDDVKGTYLSR